MIQTNQRVFATSQAGSCWVGERLTQISAHVDRNEFQKLVLLICCRARLSSIFILWSEADGRIIYQTKVIWGKWKWTKNVHLNWATLNPTSYLVKQEILLCDTGQRSARDLPMETFFFLGWVESFYFSFLFFMIWHFLDFRCAPRWWLTVNSLGRFFYARDNISKTKAA